MRRTLTLALALPVTLALTAPAALPGTAVDDPPASSAVSGPPSGAASYGTGPDRASAPTASASVGPGTDAHGGPDPLDVDASDPVPGPPSTTGSASPEAEATVGGSDGVADLAGSPGEPRGPATDGPVEATFLIASVPAAGAVVGSGPRWRYTIEVDPALGIDPEVVAVDVRAALTDERSWVRTRTLEQVDDPARARIRVVLASPGTVDELCGRAGLRTVGIYSCWNGRFAALNSWRWEVGAEAFTDLTTYRNYLVNHEFGHGLGYGHVGCPGPGAPAPVMMQQSKGVDGCLPNGWPYP